MAMVKLKKPVDNRFQADVWEQALSAEGVEYRLRTFQDTAYDGLYVSQKGYGVFYVEEEDLAKAEELVAALGQQDTPGLDSAAALAGVIEHTLLSPEAGERELAAHLEQCREMGCVAACVSPWMVPLAVSGLEGSGVAVCTVVGFPPGHPEPGHQAGRGHRAGGGRGHRVGHGAQPGPGPERGHGPGCGTRRPRSPRPSPRPGSR